MFSYYCPCFATLLACATADLIAFIWLHACACACVAWSSGFPESPLQSVAWMDGGREEGRDGKHTTGKTNYRTEGPWAKAHTHTTPLFLSVSQADTHTAPLLHIFSEGWVIPVLCNLYHHKITTVWLDNNPNAVTSTVVKRWNTTGYFRKAKDSLFFGKLDSKGYWTGIYCILRTHTRTQASKIKAHICPCMLELSSKSNLTLSFYCRDVLRRKHFLEAFSVSTSCIKETKRWWRINNKWDTVTLLENLHLGCIHHRPDVISEVTGCF